MTAMIEDNTFIKLPNNRLTYTLDSEMRGLSMLLQKVAQGVQQIAEAIAATVNSNVTIVDSNLVRVAGTGPYQKKIQNYIPHGSAFIKVLTSKETILIENPGKGNVCLNCTSRDNCIETFQICTPIIWQDQAIGVIGIFAFNEKQKKYLQERQENFLIFLKKMSELLASKVGEAVLYEEIAANNKELDAVIQNVNQGVICVNAKGKIKNINPKAINLLGLSQSTIELTEMYIQDIWPGSLMLKAIEKNQDILDKEEYLKESGFLTTVKLIYQEGNISRAVCTFTDLENIQKFAFRAREKNRDFNFDNIIGVSSKLHEIKKRARQVANFDSTTLIVGESGTGKEIFARAIHNASPRADHAFIGINCSAIPETLLESELFGYETGAFTGANSKGKPGKIELANKGTFFLDEIGDMPLFLQAKLLRVLQDRRVTKIGGVKPIELDVRIMAATNRNLEELIEKKMFREDLYYRLNVIPIYLPPLRERQEDIPVIAEHFLNTYNKKFQKSIRGFTEDAMEFLLSYSWPGNVRELENIVEYGINFAQGSYITLEDIKDRFRPFLDTRTKTLKEMVNDYEREIIAKYLDRFGWSDEGKESVAKVLGISRATLYRKLSQK